MDPANLIAAASGVLSLIAVVVSVAAARSESDLARREHVLAVTSDLLSEIRQPELRRLIRFVIEDLPALAPPSADGTLRLPVDVYEKIRPAMTYFNTVGLLVIHGTVSAEMAISVMRGAIVDTWTGLAPYVYSERARRGGDPTYYGYYEHLAALGAELGPRELDKKFKLRRLPPPEEIVGATGI